MEQAAATIDVLSFSPELEMAEVFAILRAAGFPNSELTQRLIERLLPDGTALLAPKGAVRIYSAATLSEPERSGLPSLLLDADHLCYAIATAGEAIDEASRRLRSHGNLVDSMVMDAIAVAGLNRISRHLVNRIHAWARQHGGNSSRAFSPGSGLSPWDLSRQQDVFARAPGGLLGVRLLPTFLMVPTKSISFVIGLGTTIPHDTEPFSCADCSRAQCAYRLEPMDEMIAMPPSPGSLGT